VRLIKFLALLLSMAQKARELMALTSQPPFTMIGFHFTDGTGRTFHYQRVLPVGEAQEIVETLVNEMRGFHFDGPAEIHRFFEDGDIQTETVGLLPVEEEHTDG
jgi:hypothetical protein